MAHAHARVQVGVLDLRVGANVHAVIQHAALTDGAERSHRDAVAKAGALNIAAAQDAGIAAVGVAEDDVGAHDAVAAQHCAPAQVCARLQQRAGTNADAQRQCR